MITLVYMNELLELFELASTYPDRINTWETNFLASIQKGVKSYGLDCNLTKAQMDKIEQVMEKVYEL